MAVSNRTALVLGATGFIGGHIARAALQTGWRVRGLRRTPGATGHLAEAKIQWRDGDLDDIESLKNAMEGCGVIFHAAGYYPKSKDHRPVQEHVRQGTSQTDHILQALRSVGSPLLIYTSSLTTIGQPPVGERRLANENDTYQPGSMQNNAYYEVKIAMENHFLAASESGLRCITLNPTAVFGPGDVHLTLSRLLIGVGRGWALGWLPVITNIVDVSDVAEAHIRAALMGKPGERYIIGGHNISVREALTIAARTANAPPPRFEIPMWVVEGLVRLDDALPFVSLTGNHLRAIGYWQAYDTSKARQELGLRPRPIEVTLHDAIAWLREHKYLE